MNDRKLIFPVVCFGETLWDFLPQGKLPGGAPVNVAYHLKKLGKNPAVISRIGNDDLGKELKQVFETKHIDTTFFQIDNQHSTGKVFAEIKENNEVAYKIAAPVAWDFIEFNEEVKKVVSEADYFVFGSLITRNEVSRKTLFRCLEIAKTKVVDINFRPPHFNREIVEALLKQADILKLNLAELHLITGWFKDNYERDEERVRLLQQKFSIKTIIVTKGGDGAILFMDELFFYHPGYSVTVADTVGSGDSFLAAIISKLIDGASPENALNFASALGAFVASCPGACPDYEMEEVIALIEKKNHPDS